VQLAEAFKVNRTLTSVNLLGNHIPREQAQKIVAIMPTQGNLVTLCGIKETEVELDFSNQPLRDGCVVLLSHELENNQKLASQKLIVNNDLNFFPAVDKGIWKQVLETPADRKSWFSALLFPIGQ
jgi:hypothetical protein